MHYSLVYGRENEPWNEKDMFSKEGSANCVTVSRIRRQQGILENHSIAQPYNSTKEEQATVAGPSTL